MDLFNTAPKDTYKSLLTFPDPTGYAGASFPDDTTFGQLSDGGGIISPIAVSKVAFAARPGSAGAKAYVGANPAATIMAVQSWNGSTYINAHLWGNDGVQTINGTILFSGGYRIDTTTAATLLIANTNATVVNFGNASATINMIGGFTATDKLITLNKGGAAASGTGVGFEIEENSLITGYIKTTTGLDGYLFKSPANAADTAFVFGATSARTITYPDSSGTIFFSTGLAGGQTATGGTAASENLTLSSTAHATKGKVLFGTSAYDEVDNRLGIGTASPSFKLHAALSTNAGDIAYFANSLGHGFVFGHNFANNRAYIISDSPSRTIGMGTSSQIAVFIDTGFNNQRVGIGTATPSTQLHVNGDFMTAPPTGAAGTAGAIKFGKIVLGSYINPVISEALEIEVDGGGIKHLQLVTV